MFVEHAQEYFNLKNHVLIFGTFSLFFISKTTLSWMVVLLGCFDFLIFSLILSESLCLLYLFKDFFFQDILSTLYSNTSIDFLFYSQVIKNYHSSFKFFWHICLNCFCFINTASFLVFLKISMVLQFSFATCVVTVFPSFFLHSPTPFVCVYIFHDRDFPQKSDDLWLLILIVVY